MKFFSKFWEIRSDTQFYNSGYGHPACFSNNLGTSFLQECRGDENYCVVDIETDWLLFGKQTTRIRRGCSKTV